MKKCNTSRCTNSILEGYKILTRDNIVGIGSRTGFCCACGHNLPLSHHLTHPDSNGSIFMDYNANSIAIIQGYVNRAAGNSLDTTGVLLDLSSARKLTQLFSHCQEKFREQTRGAITKEM